MIKFIKRIFERKNSYPKKSFFWTLFDSHYEQKSMICYLWENRSGCEQPLVPSKRLIKRYGLSYGSRNIEIWAILEKYINGDLIEKPKP